MLAFPRRYRHLRRYREIARILVRHGFRNLVDILGLSGYLPWPLRLRGNQASAERLSTEARVRLAIEELGPTFVKLGQIVSTRPDLIPPALMVELAKLQDEVPPAPWDAIRQQAESELGMSLSEAFVNFHKEPLAAASLGQVHAAVLPSGEEVVVKVQRPGIEQTIEIDLDILANLAALAQERTRLGRIYDFPAIAEDFSHILRGEIDYRREGRNAERFRAHFADDSAVCIPKVFWSHSTRRVLALERLRGIKIDNMPPLGEAAVDRKRLAREAARLVIKEVFDLGFFHADPHPGNLFLLENGAIGVVDFGMVGFLSPSEQIKLARLFVAAARMDFEAIVDDLIRMDAVGRGVNRPSLQRDLQWLLNKYQNVAVRDIRAKEILEDVFPVAFRHRVRLPPEYWLLAKSLVMMESLCVKLDPDFEIMTEAQPYVSQLAQRLASPSTILHSIAGGVSDWGEFLLYLPQHLPRLMSSLEDGDMRLGVRLEDPREILRRLDRMANRLSVSILIAAILVGLAILIPAFLPTTLTGLVGWLVILGFLLACALGLWFLYAWWRSGRG